MSATIDGDKSGSVPPDEPRPHRTLPRVRRAGRVPAKARSEAVPALAATACALAGLVDVAAGVLPASGHGPGAGAALGPFAAALSLGAGVLLLLLAPGLRRHGRRAQRAATVLLPAGAAAQYVHQGSVAGVLLSLAVLALLTAHHRVFRAPCDPRSRWRALAAFVLMGAGSLALGLTVVGAHPEELLGAPGPADRLEHTLAGLVGVEGPLRYTGDVSWTVAYSLGALGLLTAAATLALALRPARPAARPSPDDERRLRALLARHGEGESAGPAALRRGEAVVFSPSGRAAVRYRVVSGVMLASGDPVGDAEAWPGAIERFMDEARARSRTPAVTGCSELGGRVWTRETGLEALEPGAPEPDPGAVVDGVDFPRTGRATHDATRIPTFRTTRDLPGAGLAEPRTEGFRQPLPSDRPARAPRSSVRAVRVA